MSRFGVFVVGPAGSGKSTFCSALISHLKNSKRSCIYVNLDPAAEEFDFEPDVDIKNLISLDDAMEEMQLGPNGAMMACFEFLMENLDWLESELDDVTEDFITIFDCPGQIELYSHVPILPNLCKYLQMNLNYNLCASYLIESTFVVDKAKFFAGTLSAMSAMIMLEIPHLNILSKMDLVKSQVTKRELKRYLDPDPSIISTDIHAETNPKFHALNEAVVKLIEDFSMVSFLQLESQNEDSVQAILSYIDDCLGWSEVQEPQLKDDPDQDYEEGGEE
ncbi:GPN-loop GTPase [Pyronema domesticum]|uniref:GPN-loop GTPase 3 n=1 Tax=Pyronema omphalodes (strain CBS 100304) TaxID=1076935 RepID=U4LTD4_PYROM|nr:GPN-loop GTPase [Pyronema domesticum]CCX30736.1 Similar to GPN-loop GTPase 3 homolog AFUA_1G10640; acc. no. Q4WT40 [Pyronema omphalodes CBS 100304]